MIRQCLLMERNIKLLKSDYLISNLFTHSFFQIYLVIKPYKSLNTSFLLRHFDMTAINIMNNTLSENTISYLQKREAYLDSILPDVSEDLSQKAKAEVARFIDECIEGKKYAEKYSDLSWIRRQILSWNAYLTSKTGTYHNLGSSGEIVFPSLRCRDYIKEDDLLLAHVSGNLKALPDSQMVSLLKIINAMIDRSKLAEFCQ